MGYQKGFRGRGDRVADGVQGKFWKALESGLSPTVCPAFLPRPTAGWIRGVPVFDGYTRMVARLMGSLAVLRSVSIPKGYRDFGFGSLRAVAPKNCPDVSG